MCAYHSSCGHNSAGAAPGTNQSPEGAVETSHAQHQQVQQQRCLHSTDNVQILANSGRAGTEVSNMGKRVTGEEGDDEEEDESDEDEDDDEDDEEETEEGNARAQNGHGHEEDDEHDVRRPLKMPRKEETSASIQQLNGEVMSVMQDPGKTPWEKSQWLKLRLLHLEEQQVNHQFHAFEIEKQRLKWLKFSSKKEREMERAKLENERRRLENERMMLLVREKEIELLEIQHHHPQQHSPTREVTHLQSLDRLSY
ncbi:hypothetical protein HS088_TW0G00002 [Tripterygium wilfordii]|uniref:Uncharacterized protein n=1 Tax=Tripterygium wilfordii TaxID=458696 RepID=A0A7J7BT82_TRIWF|nr:hypothetical protein HS088_TW0G00002 [Tripterygium wilfordii]